MRDDKPDIECGTGRTSRQMVDAPENATFVWCNDHLHYAKSLARMLGRNDLRIVSPALLASDVGNVASRVAVVVDHAAQVTERQQRILVAARKA